MHKLRRCVADLYGILPIFGACGEVCDVNTSISCVKRQRAGASFTDTLREHLVDVGIHSYTLPSWWSLEPIPVTNTKMHPQRHIIGHGKIDL